MSPLAEDIEGVLSRAREYGVFRMLVVASDRPSSHDVVRIAESLAGEGLSAAVGIHPHEAETARDGLPEDICDLARKDVVVAVGETGLDYYYDNSPRDLQRKLFREHVRLAKEVKKPLVVHVRDAFEDAFKILEEEDAASCGGVIHCFCGTVEDARKAVDMGFFVSFSGLVTFPSAKGLRKTVALLPEDVILCETDSPFLAPQPMRGRTNEPANVRYVYEGVARARNVGLEDFALTVKNNAARLFRWGE
jgi:TatD DNase family protein